MLERSDSCVREVKLGLITTSNIFFPFCTLKRQSISVDQLVKFVFRFSSENKIIKHVSPVPTEYHDATGEVTVVEEPGKLSARV